MTTNPPNSGRAVVCTSTSSDDLASVDPFFALSPDLQGIWNIEGYFEQLNPAWQAVLGWTPAQLQSCPYWEWVHPHDRANTRSQVQQLNSDRPTATFFNRFRAADGYLSMAVVASHPRCGETTLVCDRARHQPHPRL
uniref:PAS domain-containing protein n=1 Tax=Desertifilum tharense IPPAS B-1220 TaxID=1781255 RepID=A0ACD5GQ87_9CYAN